MTETQLNIHVYLGTEVLATANGGEHADGTAFSWVDLVVGDSFIAFHTDHREEAEALAAALRNCARGE